MSVPHDPARIGETWNPTRLAVLREELQALRDYVVVSGGWAWHFMTPPDHVELKHAFKGGKYRFFALSPHLTVI